MKSILCVFIAISIIFSFAGCLKTEEKGTDLKPIQDKHEKIYEGIVVSSEALLVNSTSFIHCEYSVNGDHIKSQIDVACPGMWSPELKVGSKIYFKKLRISSTNLASTSHDPTSADLGVGVTLSSKDVPNAIKIKE